ncbi:MAG: bifunctional glutamate N-acetyltransferase/amino-acid acetyltransferase ArgJ [Desulfitobacterium hafniense]|nr:bifunctional glutamate N-acetyltransferase/amino-acid acetyltransferase ArgJ [Desulfitobacterium hafniense]
MADQEKNKNNIENRWTWLDSGVAAPKGFFATGVQAGIKYQNKYDVALIYSDRMAQAAGVFTRNKVKAHPLVLTQKHLEDGQAQAVVVNSGNANACVGEAGDQAALAMACETAKCLGLKTEDVLVTSTGVIGVEMPVVRVVSGIQAAAAEIKKLVGTNSSLLEAGVQADTDSKAKAETKVKSEVDNEAKTGSEAEARALVHEHGTLAARAIMTTDTTLKQVAGELGCKSGVIRVGAMAKGSGMIHPNMGTMLGFITTDAAVDHAELKDLLVQAVDESFNMVTVDGDTSTNDMVVILANGASGVTPEGEELEAFKELVSEICVKLAQEIARDGEGATKLIEVKVLGAESVDGARQIAKAICGSSLVKAAIFGEDANWGRILAAAGYSGADFNPDLVDIYLGDVIVASEGRGLNFSEEKAKEVLEQKEIVITVNLNSGQDSATAWGCDLTHEYVTINGKYRT